MPSTGLRICQFPTNDGEQGEHSPVWMAEGITLSGRQLAFHGIQPPTLHPESAVLFTLARLD